LFGEVVVALDEHANADDVREPGQVVIDVVLENGQTVRGALGGGFLGEVNRYGGGNLARG